ncbi:hypothetical protein J3F83DRAFT_659556 [Trichoderma novae-zelandiae]
MGGHLGSKGQGGGEGGEGGSEKLTRFDAGVPERGDISVSSSSKGDSAVVGKTCTLPGMKREERVLLHQCRRQRQMWCQRAELEKSFLPSLHSSRHPNHSIRPLIAISTHPMCRTPLRRGDLCLSIKLEPGALLARKRCGQGLPLTQCRVTSGFRGGSLRRAGNKWQPQPKSVYAVSLAKTHESDIRFSCSKGTASSWRLLKVLISTSTCGAGFVVLRIAPRIYNVAQRLIGCLVWISFHVWWLNRRMSQGYEDPVLDILNHEDDQSLKVVR